MIRMLLLSFMNILDNQALTTKFALNSAVKVIQVFQWVSTSPLTPCRRIVQRMTEKAGKRGDRVPFSRFKTSDNVLMELGTQQVVQVFRGAVAAHAYGRHDVRFRQAFDIIFREKKFSLEYFKGGSYIQGFKVQGVPFQFLNRTLFRFCYGSML